MAAKKVVLKVCGAGKGWLAIVTTPEALTHPRPSILRADFAHHSPDTPTSQTQQERIVRFCFAGNEQRRAFLCGCNGATLTIVSWRILMDCKNKYHTN